MASNFTTWVEVSPAFDKRHPDPSKNYGVSGCQISFFVKGSKGAVVFRIGTDWHLPHVQEEHRYKGVSNPFSDLRPSGYDLGYHSYEPRYNYQVGSTPLIDSCPVLGGYPCYYDGSTSNAVNMIPDFLEGGTDWLWPRLYEYYAQIFGDEDDS